MTLGRGPFFFFFWILHNVSYFSQHHPRSKASIPTDSYSHLHYTSSFHAHPGLSLSSVPTLEYSSTFCVASLSRSSAVVQPPRWVWAPWTGSIYVGSLVLLLRQSRLGGKGVRGGRRCLWKPFLPPRARNNNSLWQWLG